MIDFAQLTTRTWRHDNGFRAVLAANPGLVMVRGEAVEAGDRHALTNWCRELATYSLAQLLLHIGDHVVPQTLDHFGLPADLVDYLRWAQEWVTHAEPHRLSRRGAGANEIDFHPHEQLYCLWQAEESRRSAARNSKLLVYLDRVCEQDGQVVLRWEKSQRRPRRRTVVAASTLTARPNARP